MEMDSEKMISDTEIYDYLTQSRDTFRECIGNPAESRRALIKFKGWFTKNKFSILSFIESTGMSQRVLQMADLRMIFIKELDTVFSGLRNVSINRIDDETLEDMMDDLSDFFENMDLESFKISDYEISTNLSSNLQNILGFSSESSKSNIDWKPPVAPGLENSERIVPSKKET